MSVSIAIPVYNEEKTIAEVVSLVKNLDLGTEKEIIVVDDGSKDRSYEKIKNIKGIKIIRHRENMGKGAAIKTAIRNSSGDIFIVQDADLELAPKQIQKVIQPILDKKAEVVYGSRNLYEKDKTRSPLFWIGGHLITIATNLLYGTKLTDEPCGYKAFRTSILRDIKIKNNGFDWEPEITAKIAKKGIRIHEVAVVSNSRTMK
jgi:glycosyltransferase involved in cell wall biosynthesis